MDEFSLAVLPKLLGSRKKSRDPRDVRLAAVTSALVETVKERRDEDSSKNNKVDAIEVYAAALTALEGTLRQQAESMDSASSLTSPQFPLLQIIEQTLPFVTSSFFKSQFKLLTRLLCGLTMTTKGAGMISAEDKDGQNNNNNKSYETKDELGGINAKLRQILKTAKTALMFVVEEEDGMSDTDFEKTCMKLIDGTLFDLFNDKRPKVRKLAHSCVLELIVSESESMNKNMMRSHVGAYILAIFQHFKEKLEKKKSKKKKSSSSLEESMVNVMHLLQFCESGVNKLLIAQKTSICEHAIQLSAILANLAFAMQSEDAESDEEMEENDNVKKEETHIMLINSLSSLLTSVIENTEDQISEELVGRILASLIQMSTSFSVSSTSSNKKSASTHLLGAKSDFQIRQARLMVSCCTRLTSTSGNNKSIGKKLAPVALNMILIHGCDPSIVTSECVSSCASEGQRMIRNVLSSWTTDDEDDMKAIKSCQNAIEKLLHHRFRSCWDILLPVYSLFVTEINQNISDSSATRKKMISSLLTTVVDLHENLNDETSIKTIENTVGSCIQGLGMETFWSYIPLDQQKASSSSGGGKEKQYNVTSNTCIGQHRIWLIPLLISYSKATSSVRPRISFFQDTVLGLARKCDALTDDRSSTNNRKLSELEISVARSQCLDMWSLLAGVFEHHPIDIVESFPKLAKTFSKAITDKRYPELVTIISTSLNNIATVVYDNAKHSPDDKRAQEELATLEKISQKLLPVLFKLVDTLSTSNSSSTSSGMNVDRKTTASTSVIQENAQRIHHVTMAIQSFSRVASSDFLQSLFQTLLTRLLQASTSENSGKNNDDLNSRISSLLNLSHALTCSRTLDLKSISLLYRAMKPFLMVLGDTGTYSSGVQKRAYKVLCALCEHYTQFIVGDESRLNDIVEWMIQNSQHTCHIAARGLRIQCMSYVISGFDSENQKHMSVIPDIVSEILLCLKDSNAKTRESAYQLILDMCQLYQDNNNLQEYIMIIIGGLGGQTSQMRSATVMALSRIVYEYGRDVSDNGIRPLLPSLLETVCVLFNEKNSREVIKSVIGFVRIIVAAMDAEDLEPYLSTLLKDGLFKHEQPRFRAKVKIILKRLVKKFGYDKLEPFVPETRLVNHIRKMDQRLKRRKEAMKDQQKNNEQAQQQQGGFEDMMESDEDDSDDGRTLMTGFTGFTRMTSARSGKTMRTAALERSTVKSMTSKSVKSSKTLMGAGMLDGEGTNTSRGPRIQNEKDGEVFDLLDSNTMAKHVHFQDQHNNGNDTDDFDDSDDDGYGDEVMEFDDNGRLIVQDDNHRTHNDDSDDDDDEDDRMENAQIKYGKKRLKMSKFESAKATKAKSQADRSRQKQNRNKANNKNTKELGAAYKSKKAGGDVTKKGQKFEPYAYVPLDGKSYSKKNRGKAVSQMESVVRSGKRKRR